MYPINNNYSHQRSSSTHNWCRRNTFRLTFVFILFSISVATISTLLYILYKDSLKEQALAQRKKNWTQKWHIISPFIKKFPLGFLLGFIRDLIVVAIERQALP